MESVRIVYISIPRDEAEKMALALVEQRLAACVNVVPRIESYFWWDDAVQTDQESLLIVKTTKAKFERLTEYVIENHPYELPEIIALPLIAALPEYVAWVKREAGKE